MTKRTKVQKESFMFGSMRIDQEKGAGYTFYRVNVQEKFRSDERHVDNRWKCIGVATSRREIGTIIDQTVKDLLKAKGDYIGT